MIETLRERQTRLRYAAIDGDMVAREELILSLVDLCNWVARKATKRKREYFESVRSAIYEAAIEAVDSWKPEKASIGWWISMKARQPIAKALYEHSPVEPPYDAIKRKPSRWNETIAGRRFAAIYYHQKRISEGWESKAEDLVWVEPRLDPDPSVRLDAESLASRLHGRHREVIIRYFGLFRHDPESLQEIGETIGLTGRQTWTLLRQAIGKLRAMSGAECA